MTHWMGLFSRLTSRAGAQDPVPSSEERGPIMLDATDLAALLDQNAEFVFRSLRRLGVPSSSADDATQQVFMIAQQKITTILAGRERAFLFAVASNVAAHVRRTASRRREVLADDDTSIADPAPLPDVTLDRMRARALLDEVLDTLDDEERAVFVLCELEEMTMADAATLLAIPLGTVASRLRRARQSFHEAAQRVRSRLEHGAVRPLSTRAPMAAEVDR